MTSVYYNKLFVAHAIAADAEYLAPNLRKADLLELQANPSLKGMAPAEALHKSVMESDDCYVIKEIETCEQICLFGVKRVTEDVGMVWLVGSDRIKKHQVEFLKNGKTWLAGLHNTSKILYNCVHEDNKLHIKWIRWMGFKVVKRHEGIGVNGENFYEFCKLCVSF